MMKPLSLRDWIMPQPITLITNGFSPDCSRNTNPACVSKGDGDYLYGHFATMPLFQEVVTTNLLCLYSVCVTPHICLPNPPCENPLFLSYKVPLFSMTKDDLWNPTLVGEAALIHEF